GGDLGIAARLSRGDFPELAPYRLLEGGAGDVDRQIGRGERALDCGHGPLDQLLEAAIVADDRRVGEAPPKRLLAIVEGQAADAVRGRGDQHFAQRAVEGRPADRLAAAAVAPCGWLHSEPMPGVAVEAARARIA